MTRTPSVNTTGRQLSALVSGGRRFPRTAVDHQPAQLAGGVSPPARLDRLQRLLADERQPDPDSSSATTRAPPTSPALAPSERPSNGAAAMASHGTTDSTMAITPCPWTERAAEARVWMEATLEPDRLPAARQIEVFDAALAGLAPHPNT